MFFNVEEKWISKREVRSNQKERILTILPSSHIHATDMLGHTARRAPV